MKTIEIDRTLTGSVALPAEAGLGSQMLELIPRWKPDAIRESDGPRLSESLLSLGTAQPKHTVRA